MSRDGFDFAGDFTGSQLRQLTITATGEQQITADTIRSVPLADLRVKVLAAIDARPWQLTDLDRRILTIDRNRRQVETVRALAVAQLFFPDAPQRAAETVAEINGVSRSTVYRWLGEAKDAGLLTDDAVRIAQEAWRQARRVMSR